MFFGVWILEFGLFSALTKYPSPTRSSLDVLKTEYDC